MDQIITLDVGGTIFKTNKANLMKSNFFIAVFEDCSLPTTSIFIDRDPHTFKHVLALLRDPFYRYPKKYKFELRFFLIDYKEVTFYEPSEKISREVEELKKLIKLTSCIREDCDNPRTSSGIQCAEHEGRCHQGYGDFAYCDVVLEPRERIMASEMCDYHRM